MRSLRYLNTVLTIIAVLLTLNLWTAWFTAPGAQAVQIDSSAHAQGVASTGKVAAEQRKEMISLLKDLNKNVLAVNETLTSGKLRARVEAATDE